MLWCTVEIYLFKALAKSEQEHQVAKSIITNLLNRLIIILDEELLFAEWAAYLTCRSWIEDFESSERRNFSKIIRVCYAITNSRLIRLNSDINAYWFKGVNKGDIETPSSVELTDELSTELKKIKKKGDFENGNISKTCMENFISNICSGNPECYYWAHKFFNCKETGATRFKRKDSIYILWQYLFEKADNKFLKKSLDYKLKEFFVKDRKERHMWLSGAISLVLNKDKIDWDEKMFENVGGINIDIEKEIRKLFQEKKNIVLDEYVLDMHCSAGRKLNKNKADFALEGGLVVDEDKEYFVQDWRDFYIKDKIEIGTNNKKHNKDIKVKTKQDSKYKKSNIQLEDDLKFIDQSNINIESIKLCSDITCGNKVVCFEYQGKIWKEGRKSMNYNRDYICVDSCKKGFGLQQIGMERVRSNFRLEKIDKKTNIGKIIGKKL